MVINRIGYYANLNYPILKFADMEFRAQRNIYETTSDVDNYSDFIAWIGLKLRW